jgi:hypothetical protein
MYAFLIAIIHATYPHPFQPWVDYTIIIIIIIIQSNYLVTIDKFWFNDGIWFFGTPHTHTTPPPPLVSHSRFFTSCCSVVASNGRCSPSSGVSKYPWPQLPASQSNSSQWLNHSRSLTVSVTHQPTNSTDWLSQTVQLITFRHRLHRKHRSIIAVQFLLWKHVSLWSCYSIMAII